MENLLDGVEAWFSERREALAGLGLAVVIERSPADRSKQSVSVGIDSARRAGQLTVWDSGEIEMDLGGLDSGRVTVEAGQVQSFSQVETWLHRLLNWHGAPR